MFREFWKALSENEKESYLNMTGVSAGMLKKYLRITPGDRPKPSQERFDSLLLAANKVKPGSATRAQLAAYFYAAPARTGRTGQNKPEAA